MIKKIVSLLVLATISISASAISPMNMRFHCSDDTIKINTLLQEGLNSKITNPNELVVFYANKLLGTPYVAHTLEGDTEMLTINIDQLDCTTFVETLIALTQATVSQRTTWRDYANNLESVRYRNGIMGDYTSRLHYISEWIVNNNARNNLKDITPSFAKCQYIVKTIDFMSNHRDAYTSLKDDAMFEKIKDIEAGYRSHRFPYLRKSDVNAKNSKHTFKSGDIIAMVTNIKGLDVSHLGIVIKENDELYFINASMGGKKVQLEKNTFADYLDKVRSCIGVRVFRIIE